jgi:hypothetical protein
MAIHAYKLKKNWSSDSPRPSTVRSCLISSEGIWHLLAIPGTQLIMTISWKRVACWDTISGALLGTVEHTSGYWESSSPFVVPGMFSIGMAYYSRCPLARWLSVIHCDHQSPSTITVTKGFFIIWTAPEQVIFADVAVGEHMVAVIIGNSVDLDLLFCRFTDNIVHSVRLGSHAGGTLPRFIIDPPGFYIIHQGSTNESSDFIHLRASVNNPSTIDDFEVHKMSHHIPCSTASTIDSMWDHLCVPKYGVLHISGSRSTHQSTGGDAETVNGVHFWSAEVEHNSLQRTRSPLCVYEHPCDFISLATGSSGTCAITLDVQDSIGLVQYIAHPVPRAQFRRLDIREVNVDKSDILIAIDDSLGVVYILEYIREPIAEQPGSFRGSLRLTSVSYA